MQAIQYVMRTLIKPLPSHKPFKCCRCSPGATGRRKLTTSFYVESMHCSSSTHYSVKTSSKLCLGGKSLANRGLFDLGAENQRCSGRSRSCRDWSCLVCWVCDIAEIRSHSEVAETDRLCASVTALLEFTG